MNYRVAILKNELESDHMVWLDSCKANSSIIRTDVIDLLANDWFQQLGNCDYDAFILKPSGLFGHLKQLYDERVIILSELNNAVIYPSLLELLLYENKRFLRDWLVSRKLPHARTYIFYNKAEALHFLYSHNSYPMVGKTNIGASGSGVKILKTQNEVAGYIEDAFGKGIYTRTGPKFRKGTLLSKLKRIVQSGGHIGSRMQLYRQMRTSPQKGYVILQEYIPHEFEWRCVRIGDSYFAHKKVARNNMSSGTLLKDYSEVPLKLLNFIRDISEKNSLNSVAVDVFEHNNQYLINEIQCIFGQSDPYQMLVNSVPGRYRWIDNSWKFEEGMFNTNYSYDLRVSHIVEILDKRKHSDV